MQNSESCKAHPLTFCSSIGEGNRDNKEKKQSPKTRGAKLHHTAQKKSS
jgi:hypothetical protein